MDTLQRALDKVIADLPRQAFARILAEKLREQRITLSKKRLDELSKCFFAEPSETFTIEDRRRGKPRNISLTFDEGDLRNLEAKVDKVNEGMDKLIENAADKSANLGARVHAQALEGRATPAAP